MRAHETMATDENSPVEAPSSAPATWPCTATFPAGWRREDVAIVAAADPRPAARRRLPSVPDTPRCTKRPKSCWPRRRSISPTSARPRPCTRRSSARRSRSGLHVLCEKPLVLEPDELASLRALALRKDRARRGPQLASRRRSSRPQKLIEEGAIGQVRCLPLGDAAREAGRRRGDTARSNWRVDPARSSGEAS